MTQLTLESAFALADLGMSRAASAAGESFAARARAAMLDCLHAGPASGEALTDFCVEQGIVTENPRAFGPVIKGLVRDGLIEHAGFGRRVKGHGSAGSNIWRLK